MTSFHRNYSLRLLVLLLAVCLCATGCGPKGQSSSNATQEPSTPDTQQSDFATEQLMVSVTGMLQGIPERALYPIVLKQLNQYFKRRADAIEKLDEQKQKQIVALLGPQGLADLSEKDLSSIDLDYLISSIFFQTVNRNLREKGIDEDLAYVQEVFSWVVSNIQVAPLDELPMGPPLEVCLRGAGSSREISWIFLEMLRQADIPGCVVAVPPEAGSEERVPWLCGAILGGEVYLFHPELGLPVPSPKGGVATLAELAADPTIINVFGIDPSLNYPLLPAVQDKFSLLLVVEAPMFSPKMEFLQAKLTGDQRANLYLNFDELLELAQAAIQKVPGGEGVRVWQQPSQVRAANYRDPQAYQAFLQSINPFWLRMKKSPRMDQLRGRHELAVEEFVKLDMEFRPDEMNALLKQHGVDPANRGKMISQTRQDILYFCALSQLRTAEPRPAAAIEWLDRYLVEYGSPLLRENDVLAWGELSGMIATQGKGSENTLPKRIWELLPENTRKAVESVVATTGVGQQLEADLAQIKTVVGELREQRAEFGADKELRKQFEQATELLRVKSEQLQETLSISFTARRDLIQGLNHLLERTDLYDPQAVSETVFPPKAREELESRRAKMTPADWVRFNRQLMERTFNEQISKTLERWLPSALLNKAIALRLEEKPDQAIELLDKKRPSLPPIHTAVLQAHIHYWQRP